MFLVPASRLRALSAVCAVVLGATGCQSLPISDTNRLPTVVAVVDGSGDRAALNARVHDAVTEKVARSFYQRDYGGRDWPAEAAARRAQVVGQPDEAAFYRALNETLNLLDDKHTRAVRPSSNLRRAQARIGTVPGWGMALANIDDSWVVTHVREGGAAALAAVRVGWRLDTVDGQAFDPVRADASQARTFRFTGAADGVHEAALKPMSLPRSLGEVTRRPDGVLVVYFNEFDRQTRTWLLERLEQEFADTPRAVVIDLRDNGGGLDSEVARMLSPFFDERRRIGIKMFRIFPDRHVWTRRGDFGFDGPLAVLTSPSSASGAEIFAAAVQEARRGPVVGRRTAGAVVGSLQYSLPDGGRLSVGMVDFRTGSGAVLEQVGVTPDVETTATLADLRAGRDPVLEAAIGALALPALQATGAR